MRVKNVDELHLPSEKNWVSKIVYQKLAFIKFSAAKIFNRGQLQRLHGNLFIGKWIL